MDEPMLLRTILLSRKSPMWQAGGHPFRRLSSSASRIAPTAPFQKTRALDLLMLEDIGPLCSIQTGMVSKFSSVYLRLKH